MKNDKRKGGKKIIDWEERRYEIAKEAMNGLLAAPVAKNLTINLLFNEIVARTAEKAVKIADCLIEELKKGGEK